MDQKLTTLERAFQLARSGEVSRLQDIRVILKREGYVDQQIDGPVLKRQLMGLIRSARESARPPE